MTKNINEIHTSQNSELPAELIQAYLDTHYIVRSDPPITLHINKPSEQIIKLHKHYRVDSSTFITAYNPYSQSFSEKENLSRQASLVNELKKRSLRFIDGVGQHPTSEWAGEPSMLVFGLSLESSKNLGIIYEQNALVWVNELGLPKLVLLR